MMRQTYHLLFLVLIAVALSLSGCASWSSTQLEKPQLPESNVVNPTRASDIVVTETDITNRKYKSLGDITVTVNKTTIFNADPTREMVIEKLREEAAKLGADAVVLVRFGSSGISPMSWGSLNGKGRAVKFIE